MSEMGDDWREIKKWRQEKRRQNTSASTQTLEDAGIEFVSKNSGAHLIVGDYDFWPGTGLYMHRKTKKRGRGIKNLINLIRQD